MAQKKLKKFPQELFVYQCDTLEDGTAVYAVSDGVDGIPEEYDGDKVGLYVLNKSYAFRVWREVK